MTPLHALEILIATSTVLPQQLKVALLARVPDLDQGQIQAIGRFLTIEHRRTGSPEELAAAVEQLLEQPVPSVRRRALPRHAATA